MKKILIILALLALTTLSGMAQELQVKTFKEQSSDISARTNRRYDLNDKACALVKVQCAEPGATFEGFVVGDTELKTNEYWVYVSEGAKRLKIHVPGYNTIEIVFSSYGIEMLEGSNTYVVEFKFASTFSSKVYVEPGFVAGGTMGPELSFGAYLGGFNVELMARLPMGSEETVYWQSDEQMPLEYNYKPSLSVGMRLGYGINSGSKFSVTPQLGMVLTKLTESAVGSNAIQQASGANVASLTIGGKLKYMLSGHAGLSLTPEYSMPMVQSNGFKALSDASSGIKKFGSGFCCKIALDIEF